MLETDQFLNSGALVGAEAKYKINERQQKISLLLLILLTHVKLIQAAIVFVNPYRS